MFNKEKFLTIKDAAHFLGVHQNTLRNWSMRGNIKFSRHPINNYRLFKIDDLREIRDQIQ